VGALGGDAKRYDMRKCSHSDQSDKDE